MLLFRITRLVMVLWRHTPEKSFEDSSYMSFRVSPLDCDFNLHLNNGKYLQFMDLGRFRLIRQMRVLSGAIKEKWAPVIASTEMKYIRPIKPFQKVTHACRLVSWDEKFWYLEHKFIVNGKTHAIANVRGIWLKGKEVVSMDVLKAASGFQFECSSNQEAAS